MRNGRATAIATPGVMPGDDVIASEQSRFEIGNHLVLPSQTNNSPSRPELDLLHQILIQAMSDATTPTANGMPKELTARRKREQEEALCWIYAPGMRVFGYEWVCEMVGVNAQLLRAWLREQGTMRGPTRHIRHAGPRARPCEPRIRHHYDD